ncbi:MAG: Pycsar system effector family protein [Bacteroidota bacterium]
MTAEEHHLEGEVQKKKKKKKKATNSVVEGSKSAQVMFKAALRNHIDLTNIADNKANIILSINAIIITVALPLFSAYIPANHHLRLPALILLLTSMASIIFGALVTRPIKMKGVTDLSKIKDGGSNLFFFGNFYKMSITDYRKGVREVLSDEELLDNTFMTDLYYLGQSLGNKYRMLRICYTVFMIGMTLTVVTFAFAFFLAGTHPHPH